MRLDLAPGVIHVTLSVRNLRALLAKTQQQGSARTLFSGNAYRPDGEPIYDTALFVTAELDETHYLDREAPGEMHPATEALLRWAAHNDAEESAET